MIFDGLLLLLAPCPLVLQPSLKQPDLVEVVLLEAAKAFGLSGSGLAVGSGYLKKSPKFIVFGFELE